jgi:lipopolysaccharide export system protein LptA
MSLRQLFFSTVILILLGVTSFAQTADPARVAVLPFEIYSNIRTAGLQKMIAEDLSMRIADEGQITVVDHATITTLLDKTTPTFSKSALLDISEKLEADFLVLGSVTKIGDNLSLDTYLFNPRGTPSFSKNFAESKNLTALLKEMGTKISSQVLEISRNNQIAPDTEAKVAFEEAGDIESKESAVAKSQEVSGVPAGDEEVTEGPLAANTKTDSGEEALQPSGSLIEEVPEEIAAEEPVAAVADTDSEGFADQPEELEGNTDNLQPSDSLIEEVPEEIVAEETGQETAPEALEEETKEQPVIIEDQQVETPEEPLVADTDTGGGELANQPEEEDTQTTVSLLKAPDREEADNTEKESDDKSFSSPFSTLKPVKITSKTMEADNKRNLVTFKGDVVVKQEDIVIFSDTMKVSYEPEGGINKVEASGNVKMSQENRIATGKKLVFYNSEQKIVMTGSPKIWQGDNLISCEKVTVLLEDNKIVFEGKVDSIIYPRTLQEKQDENEKQVEEITFPPLGSEPAGETAVQ